jgi:bifunctional DNA-binding transcriptional regulator/antitoxin component of YhaV-PrlF toxin-antitoxin module
MVVKYSTVVLGEGNHASLVIPEWVLTKLRTNKRAPLIITINGHTYKSTATGVAGECRVVFPSADRLAAKAKADDVVEVTLEIDSGYRDVELPEDLARELEKLSITEVFSELSYSKRRELARQVSEAKGAETRARRMEKVINTLNGIQEK